MATVSKFANANTTIATGWSSPTNGYADDGSYCTAAPAKSTSITSDYGFAAFSTSDIPNGATINSCTVEIQYKSSTTSSTGAVIGLQLNNNGSLLGSESTFGMNLADQTVTKQAVAGVSLADLRNANWLKGRLRGFRSTSNTAITWSVDYVKLTVDFTPVSNVSGAEQQSAETSSAAGTTKVSGAASETGPHQTSAAAGSSSITGTAAGTMPAQTEAGAVTAMASAALAESGFAQTEAADGTTAVSASVETISPAQTEAASGDTSLAAEVAELGPAQIQAIEATAEAAALLSESSAPQAEAIEAEVSVEGSSSTATLAEVHAAQQGAMAGSVSITGSAMERHRREATAIAAEAVWAGGIDEAQAPQCCMAQVSQFPPFVHSKNELRALYRWPHTVAEGAQIRTRRGRLLPAFARVRDHYFSSPMKLEQLIESGRVVKLRKDP